MTKTKSKSKGKKPTKSEIEFAMILQKAINQYSRKKKGKKG